MYFLWKMENVHIKAKSFIHQLYNYKLDCVKQNEHRKKDNNNVVLLKLRPKCVTPNKNSHFEIFKLTFDTHSIKNLTKLTFGGLSGSKLESKKFSRAALDNF